MTHFLSVFQQIKKESTVSINNEPGWDRKIINSNKITNQNKDNPNYKITISSPQPIKIERHRNSCQKKIRRKYYMCFDQTGDISTQNRNSRKLVDKFIYLRSSVLSIETYIDTRLPNAWTANYSLSVIWKSDLSILLDGCTTWTLNKFMERNLDCNCARMLRAILNKSWRQHPKKLQLYGHLRPIIKTIKIRRAGHCRRSKDKLMYSWGPLHIDEQRQDVHLEPTYSSSVLILDVPWGPAGRNGQ